MKITYKTDTLISADEIPDGTYFKAKSGRVYLKIGTRARSISTGTTYNISNFKNVQIELVHRYENLIRYYTQEATNSTHML